jgi:hypothetical protein
MPRQAGSCLSCQTLGASEAPNDPMSKSSWIFFALAAVFYLCAWTEVAGALAIFGIGFEILMYFSMFADSEKNSKD